MNRTPSQLNKQARTELLLLKNGKAKYDEHSKYSIFLKEIKDFEGERFKQSRVGLLIQNNDFVGLSTLVRKLNFPFQTDIPHYDKQTTLNLSQKLEKVLAVIPQEVKDKLTDLDIPFVYELPPEPVVSAPVLSEVSADIIRLELIQLQGFILSALYALLTGTGVTPISTECDNQNRDYVWIQDLIQKIRAGEIPTTQNQLTHRLFQHCRNSHGCHFCRAICAILSIIRFGGNPEIDKQVCCSVWYGSTFAAQAMRHLLIQKLGSMCALAQVVCNPESPHSVMLIHLLTEMKVQEKPEEKELRQKEDEADKQLKLAKFEQHAEVERLADIAFRKQSQVDYDRGYDISKIPAAYL